MNRLSVRNYGRKGQKSSSKRKGKKGRKGQKSTSPENGKKGCCNTGGDQAVVTMKDVGNRGFLETFETTGYGGLKFIMHLLPPPPPYEEPEARSPLPLWHFRMDDGTVVKLDEGDEEWVTAEPVNSPEELKAFLKGCPPIRPRPERTKHKPPVKE
ncbi:hypothetical protein PHJA_001161000 [Phtheirospermum japonicum]|uniref:Uncharacterized protein n=1 Tax=Phtheirospermum japonicum TaxID=374723 RepID=A0A830C7E7_9LAMI|nr:hypothetical protein PHJA_001161000 [Phtheirospermum japonicum]